MLLRLLMFFPPYLQQTPVIQLVHSSTIRHKLLFIRGCLFLYLFGKKHLKLLIKDVLTADLTDIDIVKPDHGNSYDPPFTYVFPTQPPTDTPNTISAFLYH